MEYKKGQKNWKYYREGYNNPSQFTEKTLKSNSESARATIAGICQRKTDDQAGTTQFK